MNPENLKMQLEVLSDECADSRMLLMEIMAHQMVMQTVMRDFLALQGESKLKLEHQFAASLEIAKQVVQAKFGLYQLSASSRPPLEIPPTLPEEPPNN